MPAMWQRQRTGSVVCPSCGKLVGVREERCWNCGRLYPGMWGFTPLLRGLGQDLGFAKITLTGCAVLFVITLLADRTGIAGSAGFDLLQPSSNSLYAFGASGYIPVVALNRFWTVLSAGWLHGGILHLGFNMYWLTRLAPQVAEVYGPGRLVIIYSLASVVGFTVSSLAGSVQLLVNLRLGAGLTVGASAALFGLLGALVYAGRRGAISSWAGQQMWTLALLLFIFGYIMNGVDNGAHLGGFLGGYGTARLLDPLKPERADHALTALGLLAAQGLAVVWSFVTATGR
jgi:rhomboid protease GluP